MITNDTTLLAMFIPALRKKDFELFHRVIGEHLFKNLLNENISQPQIEAVLSQCGAIKFQPTNNRRVLGSMNDQKIQLEYLILAGGGLAKTNIYELSHDLNRVTFSAINRRRPIDVFKEKLNDLAK